MFHTVQVEGSAHEKRFGVRVGPTIFHSFGQQKFVRLILDCVVGAVPQFFDAAIFKVRVEEVGEVLRANVLSKTADVPELLSGFR